MRGWAAGLTIEGAGAYMLVGTTTLDEALLAAAKAIAETGRPVGLLVWRGRHAWVMSGFRATADPLTDPNDFTVTSANVYDPLYPHGSSVWGPSPRPGEALSPSEARPPVRAASDEHSWLTATGWRASQLGGKYVLVLPYTPDLARGRAARLARLGRRRGTRSTASPKRRDASRASSGRARR